MWFNHNKESNFTHIYKSEMVIGFPHDISMMLYTREPQNIDLDIHYVRYFFSPGVVYLCSIMNADIFSRELKIERELKIALEMCI